MARSKSSPNAFGRLAPRWIEDLASRQFPEIETLVGDSITSRFDDQRIRRNHVHDFVVIANQTTPEQQVDVSVLSLVCRQCDHHFVVRIDCTENDAGQLCNAGCSKYTFSNVGFPPPEDARLTHHLILSNQWTHEMVQEKRSSTYPLLCGVVFSCSVGDCPLRVIVEVSEPRLALEWSRMLKDPVRLRNNLEKARLSDPDRFNDAKEESVATAFSVLQTYICNHLADPSARKISKRNKRFQVVFGQELLPLFHALGYSEETSNNKGVPEDVLSPQPLEPAPQGTSPTPVETLRAFVDYMLIEITHNNPSEPNPGRLPSGIERLERELHCSNYAKRQDSRPIGDVSDFVKLGVLPQMHKTLVIYGYRAQCLSCPAETSFFIDSLLRVSTLLDDYDLQDQAAIEASLRDMSATSTAAFQAPLNTNDQEMAHAAARYFELSAPEIGEEDAILAKYGEKVVSDAVEAKQMLQILASFRGSTRLQEVVDGQMSYATAMDILKLDRSDQITDSAVQLYAETLLGQTHSKFLRDQVIEALHVIAEHRGSQQLLDYYRKLGGNPLDMPVGLHNIGNTCYLNSCLQVLYSITPIRDLVTKSGGHLVDLEVDDISTRKIGYNKRGVSTEEAIIGSVFAKELGNLFKQLEQTTSSALKPTQLLANSVLLNAEDIKRDAEKKRKEASKLATDLPAPPPLPDRPSPGHIEHVEDARDVDMINISADAVSETASTRSSGTLVDQIMENTGSPHAKTPEPERPAAQNTIPVATAPTAPPGEDVAMTDAPGPLEDLASKTQAILKALSTQERESGTTQQDVEETMGSMLNHLQNILVPHESTDEIQWDLVTELCFYELQKYKRKEGATTFEKMGDKVLERSIVAYPTTNGPCSVYEGISRGLDLEILEGREQVFGAISRPPPLLFMHIQRTDSLYQKNNNAVIVDEMLYLDRFMDVSRDSELMRLRQCAWHLQQQHKLLVANQPQASKQSGAPEPAPQATTFLEEEGEPTSDSVLNNRPTASLALSSQPFEFQVPDPDPLGADTVLKLPTLDVEGLPTLKDIQAMSEKQIQATRDAIEELFSQHQEVGYRLHAVICHKGQLSAGHYWNWIHDPATGRWIKYNDERVTDVTDTAKCLAELNSSGEPYFLCYARDDVKDQVVSVPKRAPQSARPSESQTEVVEITPNDMQDAADLTTAATVEISVDDMNDGFISVARQNSPVSGVYATSPPNDKNLRA